MEPTPTETWQKSPNPIVKLVVILIVLAVAGYGAYYLYNSYLKPKPADQTVAAPPIATIKITDKGFEPASIIVKPGTVIIWEASGNTKPVVVASNPYPKDDGLAGLKSPQLGSGGQYRFKFEKSGTYGYHDDLNPSVNGTVVVQ